jgi:polyisoprenoid-binding protein YceI
MEAAVTTSAGVVIEVAPESTVQLEGDSTLHRYHAKARNFSAMTVVDAGRITSTGASPTVEEVVRAGAVIGLAVVVPVAELVSTEPDLDANLRKALHAEQHPDIRYDMFEYEVRPAKTSGARLAIALAGRLTIAGVARESEVLAEAFATPLGLRFAGSLDLLMSEFGIKPPRLMLGALKVADRVTVRFDLDLRASAPQV